MYTKPQLRFIDGKFFLDVPSNETELFFQSAGRYELTLKEAAKIRQYCDDTSARIFNRRLGQQFTSSELPPLPFLDAHQVEGVAWIMSRARSYLAHAPGAGKTGQAIVASELSELLSGLTDQTLIIVPPSLTTNWMREIDKFMELMEINARTCATIPLSTDKYEMNWDAQYLICPDSMLAKSWVYQALSKKKYRMIIVDEASRFKEAASIRTVALFGGRTGKNVFQGLYQNAKRVVLLDGSPMPNRPMELWAPTFALAPESIDFMEQHEFGFKYCAPTQGYGGRWEFLGSSHEDELRERLQKDFMHVVTESALTHPERRRSLLYMNTDPRTLSHKTWERKNLSLLDPFKGEDASQGEFASYRRELGIRKVPWIANYVRERLRGKNESILLFAWHREVVELLAIELEEWNPGVVMGGVSNAEREKIFEEFQSLERKLIIANIAAAGRGHNLQAADRVIFGEFSWTDELNIQCEKRSSRRGSEKEFVRCDYICAPDSMDERVLKSIFTKASRVKRIIG